MQSPRSKVRYLTVCSISNDEPLLSCGSARDQKTSQISGLNSMQSLSTRRRKWLVATAIFLIAYCVSFACWSRIALERCESYGLVGYCFLFWYGDDMFTEEHIRQEDLVRLFYCPLIAADEKVFGKGPAPAPTARVD